MSARELAAVPPSSSDPLGLPGSAPEARECRLCFEAGGKDLIAPCHCSGTSRWVHRQCLDRWRVSGTNPKAFTHCCECGFAYCLVLQRKDSDETAFRWRRRKVIGQMLGSMLLTGVAVQTWLCLLALLIRAIDQKEDLVRVFHFPQLGDCPPIGEATFQQTIFCRKATYYLSAVLVSLALLGLLAVASVCLVSCWSTTNTRRSSSSDCDPLCCYCCGQEIADCCVTCSRCPCLECSPGSCSGCTACDSLCAGCDGPALGGIVVLVLVFFIFVGFLVLLVGIVTAIIGVVRRLVQLKELRAMTQEYVVQDLSEMPALSVLTPPPDQQQMISPEEVLLATIPGAVSDDYLEDGLERPPAYARVTDRQTQRQLTEDLRAVFGRHV